MNSVAKDLIDKIKVAVYKGSSSSDPYDPRDVSDDEYKTHMLYPSFKETDNINEQEDEEDKTKKLHEKDPEEDKEEIIKKDIPKEEPTVPEENEISSDEGIGNLGGTDMGMGGMMGEEEPKDPEILGKTYELKKIYSRLVSIESYLSSSSDIVLLRLRNYVSQAIELFETLSANVKSFKDKLNDIIVMFYEFIEIVYVLLNDYYEAERKEDKAKNKKS